MSLLDETHVVILDNASFHKSSETARLITETGASLLFLPPYAPELNPIEKDFAKLNEPGNTTQKSLLTKS